MRLLGVFAALVMVSSGVLANDLFQDGKPVELAKGSLIGADSTLGGYPIFHDPAGQWRLLDIGSTLSGTDGTADAINRGQVVLLQVDPSEKPVGSMAVMVSLSATGQNQYLSGSPCAGEHVLTINKGAGLYDNCLTVDAGSVKAIGQEFGYFEFMVVQSRSAGRSYFLKLRLDNGALGFPGTTPADWAPATMRNTPEKTEFLVRVQAWGEKLLDATSRAVEFSKPADSFAGVPSYKAMLATQ
jgi:hypothetical protein